MAMHTTFGRQVSDLDQVPLGTVSPNTSPIPASSASIKVITPQTKDDLVQQLLCNQKSSPFAQTYGAFIRKQLDNIDTKSFIPLCDILSITNNLKDEGVLLAILTIVNATADYIRSTDSRPTLKQVADTTLKNIQRDKNNVNLSTAIQPSHSDLSVYHHTIFLSMGWLSMLYEPSSEITPNFFSLQDQGTTKAGLVRFQILVQPWLSRPLVNALNGFGSPLASLSTREHEDQNTLLHVSTLTCRTLCDMGNITIEWSNVLCSHLEFDAVERKLTLFRLPSYCAMCLESEPHMRLFERSLPDNALLSRPEIRSLLQEILLSYRVLFGQTRRSRNHFKVHEKKRLKSDGQGIDTLLELLCSEPFGEKLSNLPPEFWPMSCISISKDKKSRLLEQSVYIDNTDFPVLGRRLRTIQTFSERQIPRSVRDMWRDRRNPMQWLAFWAVLWIGGITILLGFIQLFVSIVGVALQK